MRQIRIAVVTNQIEKKHCVVVTSLSCKRSQKIELYNNSTPKRFFIASVKKATIQSKKYEIFVNKKIVKKSSVSISVLFSI